MLAWFREQGKGHLSRMNAVRTGFAGRVADERVLFDRTKEFDGPAQVLQRVINAAQEMAKRMRTRSQEIAC